MDFDTMREMGEQCTAMMGHMTEMMEMHERMPMGQGHDTVAAAAPMMSSGVMAAGADGWWMLPSVVLSLLVFAGLALWRRHRGAPDAALAVLERRYVRGEIARDEYLIMKGDLAAN